MFSFLVTIVVCITIANLQSNYLEHVYPVTYVSNTTKGTTPLE